MPPPRIEFANVRGRASLLLRARDADQANQANDASAPVQVLDIERRSHGIFASDPMDAIARWDEFCSFAALQLPDATDPALDPAELGPCVPRPRQVFGIGLNYRDHAREAGLSEPKLPMVFTKFPSCIAGARAEVALTSDTVDWEVELVVVIGRAAYGVTEHDALAHVAGYCVGQDISDRRLQFEGTPPQFSLGKSAPAYGPIGPALVADPELDPTQLALTCDVNGTRMQTGNTRDMVFPVVALIAYLSRFCTLFPGDLIFTGTPAGVGSVRNPRRYLRAGDLIRSEISGLGELHNRCVER
jgi:2-keto-4-pentenoate hydratase/2-oxohepta-3-ene-1,7-dioic acid hydratase in catechol pathway